MIIIDGKNNAGKRISISIDELIYQLYCIESNGEKIARNEIRNFMEKRDSSTSRDVRSMILMEVIKPKLKKQYLEQTLITHEKKK
jgi:hypothetical protein